MGRKQKDYTGSIFGALTVVGTEKRNRKTHYKTVCVCGREKVVSAPNLISGNTKSCGECGLGTLRHGLYKNRLYARYATIKNKGLLCKEWEESVNKYIDDLFYTFEEGFRLTRYDKSQPYSIENCYWLTPSPANGVRGEEIPLDSTRRVERNWSFKDLSGKVYGRATVISLDKRENNITFYKCKCECGRIFSVRAANLVSGNTTGCSKCLPGRVIHGKYHNRLYHRYAALRERKELSAEWASSVNKFLEDVEDTFEEGFRLARYDRSRPFSLENSYWLSPRVTRNVRGDIVNFTNSPNNKKEKINEHFH